MFARHYPERMGQIVLVDPPAVFYGMLKAVYPVVDPVTKSKVHESVTATAAAILCGAGGSLHSFIHLPTAAAAIATNTAPPSSRF